MRRTSEKMSSRLRLSVNSAPELARQVELLVAGGDRDRPRVEQFGDLDRHHAQSAARAPDQHEVAGLHVRPRHQHPPHRDQHQRHRGRLLPGEVFGFGDHVDRRHLAILAMRAVERAGLKAPDLEVMAEELFAAGAVVAMAAGDAAVDHHLVAERDVVHLAPASHHYAGRVGTRNVRHQNFHSGQSAAGPDVVEIARRCLDLEHDLVWAGFGFGRYPCTVRPRGPRCARKQWLSLDFVSYAAPRACGRAQLAIRLENSSQPCV